jgi:hypothetical protein
MDLETIVTRVVELLKPANYAQIAAWVIGLYWAFSVLIGRKQNPTVAGAPVQGKRWSWEPALLLQIRFVFGAYNIISSGYDKVY